MTTLLGLVETPGQYQELIRLAELLKAQARLSQLYLVHDCGPATQRILEGFARAGAECIAADGQAVSKMRKLALGGRSSWWRNAMRFLRDTLRPAYLLVTYRRLFKQRSIDLVVVTEDSVAARARALVHVAMRAGVPVLIMPFTIPNPYEAARILGRRRDYQLHGFVAQLFAKLRPNWILDGKWIRLPLPQAITNELVGLAPARPWIDNEGPATIAVESPAMVKHYRAMGVSDHQLVLTGSLADHILERSRNERAQRQTDLRARFQLSDRPLLLCALPPDQLTHAGAASEFATYPDLLAAWIAALAAVADRFAVVVRPHPRLSEPMVAPLRQANLAICWDDTATLVPLCDLYVASISATIRWAIACGKPVVNYDVFQYRFDDYDGVPGNILVNDIAAFRQVLSELAASPDQLAALAAAQSTVARDWGCLDGESSRRMLALIDRLLTSASRKPN
jgi:hypothetical protein